MTDLYEQMEERNEVVVSMFRTAESDIDVASEKGAFAFIIGESLTDALCIEGDISGDGKFASATVAGYRDGEPVDVSVMEIDGKVMVTLSLD